MKSSIAVVGPGAIGGTVAAHLIHASRHDITLCGRTRFAELHIDLPDGGSLTSMPNVLVDPAAASPFDWVFVATKAYDTAGAARWLEKLAGPATHVAILQNGVEHLERFCDHVPTARLLPVMVDLPAERSAPGRIRQRRRGVLRVPASAAGREFAALFAGADLDAATTPDFLTVAWRKLALNSIGAVNALTLRPAGVARDSAVAALMHTMVLEVIAVA
ncbi:MAG TPA: 2-dehydropantoate 2-reductase N-terminal domain-containing protein, partial [Opitutus sp.]|nr:2-dehydropantoate 2-reductase N-terminal domain-containing protein [Opitutus sp.]